jgi:short-subunit dehydrogenase
MQDAHPKRPLAVVTGASSGIGYELAKVLSENGFDLVVAAEDKGIVEARQALAAHGVAVEAVQVDLASPSGTRELDAHLQALGRPVDALVLNAGVGVGGDFVDTDLDAELKLIQLNVVSPVQLCKRIAQRMAERGAGRIMFTSSVASTAPGPHYAVYAASKAFIQSFAQAIRNELKDSGVTVTALMPGATDTNFFARAGMEDTKAGAGPKDDPADVARQGYDAMMAGKDHVVAGSLMNSVQAGMAKVLPETVTAAMQGRETKPGSAPAP